MSLVVICRHEINKISTYNKLYLKLKNTIMKRRILMFAFLTCIAVVTFLRTP